MKKIILLIILLSSTVILLPKDASAEACTFIPPTNTGTSTLSTTTTAGTYRIWSRMKAKDAVNNKFYIQIDSNCTEPVGDSPSISATEWTWVDYSNNNTAAKLNVVLTAGTHVVTIIGGEPGVGVDKILLTKNLTCVPVNLGDNCPAETPTSTPSPTPLDTTPPTISSIVTPSITNSSATIEWSLSEGATGQIEYGTTANYGSLSILETGLLTFHKQTISNLTPDTLYHYRIKSKDAANNTATSSDRTFTTVGPTPTFTPSPSPADTFLAFSNLKLHGIGKGGDNVNPSGTGNNNPLNPTRSLTVELYDTSGVLVLSANGNVTYTSATGDFQGSIKLPSSIVSGSYLIKTSSSKYLRKRLTGAINVTKGITNQAPQTSLVTGDINGDQDLNILDFNILKGCYSDLLPAANCTPEKKAAADISDDGNVNGDDLTLFQREASVRTGD